MDPLVPPPAAPAPLPAEQRGDPDPAPSADRPLLSLAPSRRPRAPRHLAELSPAQRREVATELGEPAFRAGQVARHYFVGHRDDPQTWSDVPTGSRRSLADALTPRLLTAVRHVDCDGGATRKSLWRLHDGVTVESVLMRYPDRVTVCVSSQAGCGMGCPFCATGQAGLTRNLTTAEIVDQVVAGGRALDAGELAGGPGRVSNVVFMGMGEPLANYGATVAAVRALCAPAPEGAGLSRRAVTVSTVGLAPAIRRLSAERLGVTLALSLHAPDDELRDTLVPVNTRWPVAEVLAAARDYAEDSSRRVSIEYALIRGVNDQAWRADCLAEALCAHGGSRWVHVNLIPLNPTPGSQWTASRPPDEREFVRRLQAAGIAVTVRDTRGREVEGACGQLAGGTG